MTLRNLLIVAVWLALINMAGIVMKVSLRVRTRVLIIASVVVCYVLELDK